MQLRGGIDRLRQSVDSVAQSRAKLEQLAAAENPNSATVQALERQLQQHQADLDTQRQQQDELAHKVGLEPALFVVAYACVCAHVASLLKTVLRC